MSDGSQYFFTYIVRCRDGTLYTGWARDVAKRVAVHNAGKGAKYTQGRRPVVLVGRWRFETQSEAMRWELFIKALPRPAKERLIAEQSGENGASLSP